MTEQAMQLRALLMCLGDASWSPRTIRLSKYLSARGYSVNIASKPLSREIDCDNHIPLSQPPKPRNPLTRRFPRYAYFVAYLPSDILKDAVNTYRYGLHGLNTVLQADLYDLIIVQDLALLPIALRHKKNARLIFDAREYYPAQNEENSRFRKFERPERIRLCARDLPKCDGIITVSNGLADAYRRNFGVSPLVIHSASAFHDIDPSPVQSDRIRLVHHGVANTNRGLKNLFALMERLRPEFTLDLYLVTTDVKRIAEMQEMAEASGRVTLHAPVPYKRIIPELNQYDMGVIYYEPTSYNLKHCMPNKLFEYVQARLAVAIGPSPDMADFLTDHGCGVVSASFSIDSLAQVLNSLGPEAIVELKANSGKASRVSSMEREQSKLDCLIGQGD